MRIRIATAGAALLIAGCAHVGAASDRPDARSLAGTQWTIAGINGVTPTAGRKTEMRFTADRVSGNAGCNGFGGGYTFADGVMTTTRLVSTKMACPGPGMAQEDAVFKILARPATVSWQADGSLTLSDDAGTMTLTPAG
jgi:heat shock protein HslJ